MKYPRTPKRTTPAFAFSIARRALIEGIADRHFGDPEKQEVIAFFGGPRSCVFCGQRPIQRWDHLVAISKGGDTVLGNMVPACARCDDSKGAKDFRKWALGDAKYSPNKQGVPDIQKRLNQIDKYVAKFNYHSQSPKERLCPKDFRAFEHLREERRQLHNKFDAFIVRCQKSVGGE